MAITNKLNSSVLPVTEKASSTPASMRGAFSEWLSDGNGKKFSPQVTIACLDKISEYVKSKKISCSLWEIYKPSVFKPVYQKVSNEKLLRIMEKSTYEVFTVAGPLYMKFLKEKPWEKINEEVQALPINILQNADKVSGSIDSQVDSVETSLLPDINTHDVIAWLLTQPNANGTLNSDNIMRALRKAPQKLTLDDSINRNVFACHTVEELDKLWCAFKAASNYIEVNHTLWHGQLSAGLSAYRRYIEYLEGNGQPVKNAERVDLVSKSQTTKKIPQQLNSDTVVSTSFVPDSLIGALNQNYASGFRFETTALRLLSTTAGVEIDDRMQAALKQKMFRRDDGVCFLFDTVADTSTRKDIVESADAYLQEYGCFEIPVFYKQYEDQVNCKCIENAHDFESFYEQISNSGVRCVAAPQIGNRIARFRNGNVWGTFKEVSVKIVSAITNEFYGSVNEDDLHSKFCAFSTDLLSKIIKNCAADKLMRVEINESICYQTFDALGLPDNFSEVLSETLERLGDIGLEPSQDVLHTAISLKLGVNFLVEFNLPDWDAYRRLIAVFYKAEPRREWKRNIFGEVRG